MPEHANLAVAADGLARFHQCLVYGKILMICSHNLCRAPILVVETQEVLQNVDKPFPSEDALKECLIVDNLYGLCLAVTALPLHISVGLGCQRSCLGGQHVAGHTKGVIDKQRRAFLLILLDLQIGILFLHVVVGRRFQFYHHQGQTVHEDHNVAANLLFLHHAPLVANLELVMQGMLEVYQPNKRRLLSPLFRVFHFHAVLQVVHHLLIPLLQRTLIHVGHYPVGLRQHFVDRLRILLAQRILQVGHIPRLAEVSLHVVAILILVAHPLKQVYQRLLVAVFCELVYTHITYFYFLYFFFQSITLFLRISLSQEIKY